MTDQSRVDTVNAYVAIAYTQSIGYGKTMSVSDLADALQVSDSAVKSWRETGNPSLKHFMRSVPHLGAAFANTALQAVGYTGAHPMTGWGQGTGHAIAEMMHHMADLMEKWSDGRIDHQELAELRQTYPEFVAVVNQYGADIMKGAKLECVS